MSSRSRARRGESGQVLVVTLFVLVVVMAAMALVAASLGLQSRLVEHQERQVRLAALLDAGLATSLARLHLSRGYPGELADLGGGSFRTQVEATGFERFEVRVRATWGTASREVLAEVHADGVRPPRVLGWRPVRAEDQGVSGSS